MPKKKDSAYDILEENGFVNMKKNWDEQQKALKKRLSLDMQKYDEATLVIKSSVAFGTQVYWTPSTADNIDCEEAINKLVEKLQQARDRRVLLSKKNIEEIFTANDNDNEPFSGVFLLANLLKKILGPDKLEIHASFFNKNNKFVKRGANNSAETNLKFLILAFVSYEYENQDEASKLSFNRFISSYIGVFIEARKRFKMEKDLMVFVENNVAKFSDENLDQIPEIPVQQTEQNMMDDGSGQKSMVYEFVPHSNAKHDETKLIFCEENGLIRKFSMVDGVSKDESHDKKTQSNGERQINSATRIVLSRNCKRQKKFV